MANNKDSVYPLLKQGQLPRHVAIIMDGNGRWAAGRGMARVEGHKAGAKTVDLIIQSCVELGISYLSLYAFSTENWKRPQTEVSALFDLLNFYIKNKINMMLKNGISLMVSGDIAALPEKSRKLIANGIEKTKGLNKLTLNVCLNYGSRDELTSAIEKLIKNRITKGDVKKISERPSWSEIEENLYTHGLPEIDLLIRTAGEKRLSNFMLLQAAYAELYFTDATWPDFDKSEFYNALIEFQRRTRKFGGLPEQKVERNNIGNLNE